MSCLPRPSDNKGPHRYSRSQPQKIAQSTATILQTLRCRCGRAKTAMYTESSPEKLQSNTLQSVHRLGIHKDPARTPAGPALSDSDLELLSRAPALRSHRLS